MFIPFKIGVSVGILVAIGLLKIMMWEKSTVGLIVCSTLRKSALSTLIIPHFSNW